MSKRDMGYCKTCGNEVAKSAKTCPNCGGKLKKNKITIGIVTVLALAVIGSIGGGSDSKGLDTYESNKDTTIVGIETPSETSSQSESSETKEKTKDNVVKNVEIVLTVDEMVDDLEENALKAANTYKNKYVKVTGVLSNIDSSGKYFSIGRNDGSFTLSNVTCNIKSEHLDTVANFSKEQTVTVIGTITDVGEIMGYRLKVESIQN